MAEIVIGAALSHSPLMNFDVPADSQAAVAAYREAARVLSEQVRAAKPDVLVIFAQDHFRTAFYNNMPAFLIGVGEVTRWGDWRGSQGPLKTDVALARHIARGLFARNFEPSLSYDMRVDHGTAQVLELFGMTDMPVIPILVNAAAPPLPTPARCYAFGEALRQTLQDFAPRRRVAVIGSGGLSHSPLNVSIETEQNPQARAFFIHGRAAPGVTEEDRIKGILGKIDTLAGAIRPEWDRMLLKRIEAGEARSLAAELDSASIQAGGGSGGQEFRSWLAMLGAAQADQVSTVYYEPVRFLVTGMGAVVARCPQSQAAEGQA
jgi:2,3-dihydroxyphenylpropionate 1,2-dioxygenase